MRPARPLPRLPLPAVPRPTLVPPLDWTERAAHKAAVRELERILPIARQREAQLIREAEHAAELRFLRRKAELLARISAAVNSQGAKEPRRPTSADSAPSSSTAAESTREER